MNKKRIVIISVTAVALVVCIALAVTFIVLNAGGHRHKFGEWYTTVAPTCETYGTERRTCKKCDEYEERPVTRLGHEFSIANVCTRCKWEIPVTVGLRYTPTESGESYIVDAGTLDASVHEIYIPRYNAEKPVDAISYAAFRERAITFVFIPDAKRSG